jgi:lysylphosphatidylglycerol synthetase-like protein (DUF2156 family)
MTGAALSLWSVVGLVAGWMLHRIIDEGTGTAPLISWAQPLALLLVAAILGGTAWSTYRNIRQHRGALSPHHAVNRLVLARACAYVGCLMAGAYFGYAVSWLGVDSDLAHQRAIRSAFAGAAGVLAVIAALLLERACRVPGDDDEP